MVVENSDVARRGAARRGLGWSRGKGGSSVIAVIELLIKPVN
jgi:hypothetical protein